MLLILFNYAVQGPSNEIVSEKKLIKRIFSS